LLKSEEESKMGDGALPELPAPDAARLVTFWICPV